MEEQEINNEGKNKKKKIFLFVGVGLGLLAVTGLGYWYFFGRKNSDGTDAKNSDNEIFKKLQNNSGGGEDIETTKPKHKHTTAPTNEAKNPNADSAAPAKNTPELHSGFPLKMHSRGALVKQLQQALIKNYGKQILPKWGADGSFGTEVVNALQSKGFNDTVDFVEFTKIISGGTASKPPSSSSNNIAPAKNSFDADAAVTVATSLKEKISAADFWGTVAALKKITNPSDYKTVNTVFKSLKIDGEEKNISEAVLSQFTDGTQNALLILQFGKMGLRPENGVWTVSGFSSPRIMTCCTTTIRNENGVSMEVPRSTILGNKICDRNGKTSFRAIDGQTMYVPTKHICHV